MKNFNFRLEKVLNLRKANEEKAKRALGEQLKRLNDACELLKNMQEEQQQFVESQKGKRTGVVDIRQWKNFSSFISSKKIKEMEQTAKVNIENMQLAYKKNDYIRMSREKKIIEKLREKQEKGYNKTCLRDEQKTFDDIAGQRFLKNGDL